MRVRVTRRPSPDGAGYVLRISVWGADDLGMERETTCSREALAATEAELLRFVQHELPNPLNRDWLRARGFESC